MPVVKLLVTDQRKASRKTGTPSDCGDCLRRIFAGSSYSIVMFTRFEGDIWVSLTYGPNIAFPSRFTAKMLPARLVKSADAGPKYCASWGWAFPPKELVISSGVDETFVVLIAENPSSKPTFGEYVVFCKVHANVPQLWSTWAGSKPSTDGFLIGLTLSLLKNCIHMVENFEEKRSGSVAA